MYNLLNFLIATQHAVAYSISEGKFINVVATAHDKSKDGTTWEGPWSSEVSKEEFLGQFIGWDDEFQEIIKVPA
jgi:salicylate hydroxylase